MKPPKTGNPARPSSASETRHIDINLFAGAGGLAFGLVEAGFQLSQLFERDPYCCRTLRWNHKSRTPHATVHEGDVTTVDWRPFEGKVRLLAGGVPCQPFSLAGKHRAELDHRNLFPETFRAIREIRPAAVIIENVRGLLRRSFQPYFEYILRQLQAPSVHPKRGEDWWDHDQRIRRQQCASGFRPEYHVEWRLLDAADYGVLQNRQRVFIVATRRSHLRVS